MSLESGAPGGPFSVSLSGTGAEPEPGLPPRARFTRKPKKRIEVRGKRLRKLKVAFTADQAGSSYRCSLDGRRLAPCSSPMRLEGLRLGRHSFKVRAVSAAGLAGPSAVARFRVAKVARDAR